MKAVPFYDLARVNEPLRADLENVARETIGTGWFVLGDKLEAFERSFAVFCGTKYAVGVASGLDALILTLRSWKLQGLLKDGDGVVVAANTFIATIMAIFENGLRPILAEPDPRTCNLSTQGLTSALSKQPKAVIAVHLYGRLCPMPELRRICDEKGLLLLEDSAQAHGAFLDGKRAGSFGRAGAFSFYPTKNLGALGDGGAVITDDPTLAALLRSLRNYGCDQKYVNLHQGLNSRLDDMQAAFLNVKLPHLEQQNAARRHIARRYIAEISNPAIDLPTLPATERSHVWHLFVIHCRKRNALARHLQKHGIQTGIHYPIPPHRQACYRGLLGGLQLPLTEKLHDECLSLPMSPVMSITEVEQVIRAVNAFDPSLSD